MSDFVQPTKPPTPPKSTPEKEASKPGTSKATTAKGSTRKSSGKQDPEPSTSTVRGKGTSQGPGKKALPRKPKRVEPEVESSSEEEEDAPGPERVPSSGRTMTIEEREEILRQERAAFEKQRLEFEARVHLFGHNPPPETGEEQAAEKKKPVTREEMEIAFSKAFG